MKITFDKAKRERTLRQRGLDFADAAEVFKGLHTLLADDRFDYGETRYISAGHLRGRMVVIVWTPHRSQACAGCVNLPARRRGTSSL